MSIRVSGSLFLTAIVAFAFSGHVAAQTFVSIGEGFECVTDIDGSVYLATLSDAGLTQVSQKKVTTKIQRLIEGVKTKQEKLTNILEGKKSLLDRLLLKFLAAFNVSFPSSGVPAEYSDAEQRKGAIRAARQFLAGRKKTLAGVLKQAKKCKGTGKPGQNGTIITPSAKLVSFRGQSEAYAGYLYLTPPRKSIGATKPGGFNICLITTDPTNGSVSSFYTGAGKEVCFSGGGVVQDSAVAACNNTVPSGFVGRYFNIVKGIDTSDEGLRNLEAFALERGPAMVQFLALDQFKGSRDKAIARCNQFVR